MDCFLRQAAEEGCCKAVLVATMKSEPITSAEAKLHR
jgi:hypothetical protein